MPLLAGNRLYSNREQLSKLSDRRLAAYRKGLEDFLFTNSPIIAMTLKQVYQEIEWRGAENTKKQARPRRVG